MEGPSQNCTLKLLFRHRMVICTEEHLSCPGTLLRMKLLFSHFCLFVTPWTVACQAPLSMGFSWPLYWSGLPCPFLRDPPDPGIKPTSPVWQEDFFFNHRGTREVLLRTKGAIVNTQVARPELKHPGHTRVCGH